MDSCLGQSQLHNAAPHVLKAPNALGRRYGASTRQHAPVDRQHGARDPAGIPARQEQNRLYYVLGLAVPA